MDASCVLTCIHLPEWLKYNFFGFLELFGFFLEPLLSKVKLFLDNQVELLLTPFSDHMNLNNFQFGKWGKSSLSHSSKFACTTPEKPWFSWFMKRCQKEFNKGVQKELKSNEGFKIWTSCFKKHDWQWPKIQNLVKNDHLSISRNYLSKSSTFWTTLLNSFGLLFKILWVWITLTDSWYGQEHEI